MTPAVLEVRDLTVTFKTPTGPVQAVRGVDFDVQPGEIVGVVGESGCGKSATFRAILGLIGRTADVDGEVRYRGEAISLSGDLQTVSALVYQNPGAALNPVFTVGQQLELVAKSDDHKVLTGLLDQVGLPDPASVLDAYPHELSGGMQQRAVIAIALAQRPDLLIADEPTTALDVTTQARILDLLDELRAPGSIAIVLISHDVGVIGRLADRVAVMYAGRIVEVGSADQVLGAPGHPYSHALLAATPGAHNIGDELATIPGQVPDGRSPIAGCSYADRCPHADEVCLEAEPRLQPIGNGHGVACVRPRAWT